MHFLSKEHLPFTIFAILIWISLSLTPLLLIFYPCKIFKRCLNCCHNRIWHALHTFVEAFQGCYKDGVTGGRDLRSMSGVYSLFRFILIYHVVLYWLRLCKLHREKLLLGAIHLILIEMILLKYVYTS